jgi:hypothetical protein
MFIIILLYFISYFYQITFYTKNETYNILKNNRKFYDNFHKIDLEVRNVRNINEYIDNIKNDVRNFTLFEKIRLYNCCRIADEKIRNKNYKWFDGNKAYNIKWKFGCVDKYYEKGFPHTVYGEIIILSKLLLNTYTDSQIIKTLIHEKTHLYQNKYKDDIKYYLDKNGIVYYKKREKTDNIRVNPDTDNLIYKNNNENFYYGATFDNNPDNLNDVSYHNNSSKNEHPYEQMAYEISS